jgi:hypothetical protein
MEIVALLEQQGMALSEFLATASIGLAGGWLFYRIWRALAPPAQAREFSRHMMQQLRGMIGSEDPNEVFRHYRALLVSLGRYAGRNLLAVLVAVVPLSVAWLLYEGLLLDEHSEALSVQPPLDAFPLSPAEIYLCIFATLGSLAAFGFNRLGRRRPT